MMKIFDANISGQTITYLREYLSNISSFEIANQKLKNICGIEYFFPIMMILKALLN